MVLTRINSFAQFRLTCLLIVCISLPNTGIAQAASAEIASCRFTIFSDPGVVKMFKAGRENPDKAHALVSTDLPVLF